MPTYKHPCPHCGTFINRDVVACPKCGTRDPFAPGRCPACGAVIEDASWVACPRCGKPVGAAAVAAANASANAGTVQLPGQETTPASPPLAAPGTSAASGAIPGWGQPVAPPAAAPLEPTPPPAAATSAAPCAACGSPLAQGARFCLDCGAAVT